MAWLVLGQTCQFYGWGLKCKDKAFYKRADAF